jgi:hypothetical protein
MFVLRISVNTNSVGSIKADLTKALPEVKSSHRVEAIARGLGFDTNAALRAAIENETTERQVDGAAFMAYLKSKEFAVSERAFYVAAARTAVQKVLSEIPQLTVSGVGIGRRQKLDNGKLETLEEYDARFLYGRNECLDDNSIEQFLLSLAFVAKIEPTKTINRQNSGSYRLKHIAEEWSCSYPDGTELGPQYVRNGMLIAAAVHYGFKYRISMDEFGYYNPNVQFNMSKRCIEDVDYEIRPYTAQERHLRKERRKNEAAARVNLRALVATNLARSGNRPAAWAKAEKLTRSIERTSLSSIANINIDTSEIDPSITDEIDLCPSCQRNWKSRYTTQCAVCAD